MEQQGLHLQDYVQHSNELEAQKKVLLNYLNAIEQTVQQYRNVIEQANSVDTMNMGEVLLPQMMNSIHELEACHQHIEEKNHQKI